MKAFFTLRWILTTLLVIAALGVLVALGFWQLDRLSQKRAFIARANAQISAAPESITHFLTPPEDMPDLEYRPVTATGTYDFSNEILVRNQIVGGEPGYRIVTPLHLEGTDSTVLVDRGWIPLKEGQAYQPGQFNEPGKVSIAGVVRRTQPEPTIGGVPDPTLAPGQSRLAAWNFIDISRIQQQVSYPLVPVFIQQAPDPSWTGAPVRSLEDPVLDEGPHLGYAVQWFSFAAVLAVGYPFFVRRSLRDRKKS
jgi:surfeit locus 1 family protein